MGVSKEMVVKGLRKFLIGIIRRHAPARIKLMLGLFPAPLRSEKKALIRVLRTGEWNMSYGPIPVHVRLENEFANFVGANYGIAVGGGGMGIQMSLRALGLDRNSEVLMQVDTCSAVAFSAINAQTIPRFFDANEDTFLSDLPSLESKFTRNTKAVISSHLWGNPDYITELKRVVDNSDAYLIEDCCLALGTTLSNRQVGTSGKVGIFSFGSTKPIQAGEGGMIVTDDEALARELRAMRHWGERTKDFGKRDVSVASWNGRISEFSAAVALEQLKGFPDFLERIRENVKILDRYLSNDSDIGKLNLGNGKSLDESSFTQAVISLDRARPHLKARLLTHLANHRIQAFHANFEPIPTLSVFKSKEWEKWINKTDWDPEAEIHASNFTNAYDIYNARGIGLARSNFQSKFKVRKLIAALQSFDANL